MLKPMAPNEPNPTINAKFMVERFIVLDGSDNEKSYEVLLVISVTPPEYNLNEKFNCMSITSVVSGTDIK